MAVQRIESRMVGQIPAKIIVEDTVVGTVKNWSVYEDKRTRQSVLVIDDKQEFRNVEVKEIPIYNELGQDTIGTPIRALTNMEIEIHIPLGEWSRQGKVGGPFKNLNPEPRWMIEGFRDGPVGDLPVSHSPSLLDTIAGNLGVPADLMQPNPTPELFPLTELANQKVGDCFKYADRYWIYLEKVPISKIHNHVTADFATVYAASCQAADGEVQTIGLASKVSPVDFSVFSTVEEENHD